MSANIIVCLSIYLFLLQIIIKIVMQITIMLIPKPMKDTDRKSIYLQIQNPIANAF